MSKNLGHIGWHYRVKEAREYPAPCEPQPGRVYMLFPADVLAKEGDKGTYRCMTGLSIGGIVLKDDEVERVYSDGHLVLL